MTLAAIQPTRSELPSSPTWISIPLGAQAGLHEASENRGVQSGANTWVHPSGSFSLAVVLHNPFLLRNDYNCFFPCGILRALAGSYPNSQHSG